LIRGFIGAVKTLGSLMRRQDVPQKARDVVQHAKENKGAAKEGCKGGGTFKNDNRAGGQALPKTDSAGSKITYKEYDVIPIKMA